MFLLTRFRKTLKEANRLVIEAGGDIRKLNCTDEEVDGILSADAYWRFTRSLKNKEMRKDLKHLQQVLHIKK